MFEHATTTTKQGDIGEARAIFEYTRLGYTILKPLTDSDRFDLVIYKDGTFLKVQVKTSRQAVTKGKDRYAVGIKQTGGNRKINTIRYPQPGDFDLLFILVEDGRCFSIPWEALNGIHSVVTVGGKKYQEYNI